MKSFCLADLKDIYIVYIYIYTGTVVLPAHFVGQEKYKAIADSTRSTRSWSRPRSWSRTWHSLCTRIGSILFFFFRNWLIRTLFTPSLLLGWVIATGHESTGRAWFWLAWFSWLSVHPYWPSSLPLHLPYRYLLTKSGPAQLFPRGLPIPFAWSSMACVMC